VLIDAHLHLCEYNHRDYLWISGEMTSLHHSFLVPELEALMRDARVGGTVVVQARQRTQETEWLLGLAEHNPFILGEVGCVPLSAPELAKELDRFALRPQLKAVRHVLHNEPDDLYMLRDDFNRGVALLRDRHLAYNILKFERHPLQTIEFVDRHPRQVHIVDHIAKPRIREDALSPWKENLRELARRQNVYCKISGMATEADRKKLERGPTKALLRCGAFGIRCASADVRARLARLNSGRRLQPLGRHVPIVHRGAIPRRAGKNLQQNGQDCIQSMNPQ
jgi:L-fuconolactonase